MRNIAVWGRTLIKVSIFSFATQTDYNVVTVIDCWRTCHMRERNFNPSVHHVESLIALAMIRWRVKWVKEFSPSSPSTWFESMTLHSSDSRKHSKCFDQNDANSDAYGLFPIFLVIWLELWWVLRWERSISTDDQLLRWLFQEGANRRPTISYDHLGDRIQSNYHYNWKNKPSARNREVISAPNYSIKDKLLPVWAEIEVFPNIDANWSTANTPKQRHRHLIPVRFPSRDHPFSSGHLTMTSQFAFHQLLRRVMRRSPASFTRAAHVKCCGRNNNLLISHR